MTIMDIDRPSARKSPSPHHEVHKRKSLSRTGSPLNRIDKVSHLDRVPAANGSLWDGRPEGSSASFLDAYPAEAERVRVTIRVRPATLEEEESDVEPVMEIDPGKGIVILHRDESTEFQFDAVLPPSATQGDIYRVAARPVVADVLNGYNGTIMAYGQTGAGKTYTLSSTQQGHVGIMPRAAAEVFTMARADDAHVYRVSMSYIQIYMEMIQDLLRPSSSNMQIRESESGVYISGVEEVEVKCVEDCLKLLSLGERNRAFAFTKLNAHSSRSHAIAVITVEKKRNERNSEEGQEQSKGQDGPEERKSPLVQRDKLLVGKLFLVDLAGSERLKKSGSEGVRASEAKSVNLSLTSLGKCINARADPMATHVPFRDSKLTRLLQESLGGNAKTSLVINVAPTAHHISESMSSLLFGSRAMKVKTKAQVNEEEEYRQLSRNLQETIDLHDDRVHSLEVVVYSQEEQLAQAKAKLDMQAVQLGQVQSEKDAVAAAHAQELAARDAAWQGRLLEVQESAQQALEEAQQIYRMNLTETVTALNSERDSLMEALQEAHARTSELEEQIRRTEQDKQRVLSVAEQREENVRKAFLEEAEQKAKEEAAALAIQSGFRSQKHREVMLQLASTRKRVEEGDQQALKLEAERARLQELAVAAGHRLVAGSLAHMTSALTALNHRFLTPRNKL